jgi:hypothetical protein
MIIIERSILKKGHIGFKVSNYQNFDYKCTWRTPIDVTKPWAGFYIGTTEDVADGYKDDYQHPYRHAVTLLQDLDIIICTGPELANSQIPGMAKAEMVTEALPDDLKDAVRKQNKPLMDALGELGFCYQGPHDDEGGIEIVIPNKLTHLVSLKMKIDFGVNKYYL